MEGSIITVVEPSKCLTSIRKSHGRKLERSGEQVGLLLYRQIRNGDPTRFLERFSRKSIQSFGRTDTDSRAAVAAQRLKLHGLQYNSFRLLYSVTLESELRWTTDALVDHYSYSRYRKEICFSALPLYGVLLRSMFHFLS